MKCDKLRIENDCVYGPDAKVYLAEQVDAAIDELKDKIQMHDFFWDGCGFKRRGFKNAIAVAQYVEDLEAELRATRRALWIARAERARAMSVYWYVKKTEITNYKIFETKWSNIERKCRAKAEEYKR